MMKRDQENAKLAVVLAGLVEAGASHVLITFSGCGDSGDVDSYTAIPPSLIDAEGNLIHNYYESKFTKATAAMPDINGDMQNVLWDFCHQKTETYDWWNNDGGDGSILINLTTYEYKCDWNINYTTSDNYSSAGKIEV